MVKLALLRDNISDDKKRARLIELYSYIESNLTYIVNYEVRAQANQTYISQVAESNIESLINARQKRLKKTQWTREGAHQVLQTRAQMESGDCPPLGTAIVGDPADKHGDEFSYET